MGESKIYTKWAMTTNFQHKIDMDQSTAKQVWVIAHVQEINSLVGNGQEAWYSDRIWAEEMVIGWLWIEQVVYWLDMGSRRD